MEGIAVAYQVADAEDKNWNEEWERNGFEPILIAGDIFVHSTRHAPLPTAEYDITINPRQAFGTGTHQTTGMILEILLGMNLEGRTVADAGCGTGILGIFCALKGAEHVFGYDVDSWSVENTKENMRLNGVSQMEVVEGNSAVLQGKGTFDIVLANINRNILLADLPAFRSAPRHRANSSSADSTPRTARCSSGKRKHWDWPAPGKRKKRRLGRAPARATTLIGCLPAPPRVRAL